MFNLSGAINVLLFLIVRPQLLLFPRPDVLGEPDVELVADQGPGSPILTDNASFVLSPEPLSTIALEDEGSRRSPELSPISPRGMLI